VAADLVAVMTPAMDSVLAFETELSDPAEANEEVNQILAAALTYSPGGSPGAAPEPTRGMVLPGHDRRTATSRRSRSVMSENDRPGRGIRVGDQEREEAVRRLGEHYESGRLTADEHTERVGEALKAKTHEDLGALFNDLPGGHRPEPEGTPWGAGMPWGAPWTAPKDRPGERRGGPPWARGDRRWRGIPLPLLIALGALALSASVACTVAGGHPPVLLFVLLTVATVALVRRRARGWQA